MRSQIQRLLRGVTGGVIACGLLIVVAGCGQDQPSASLGGPVVAFITCAADGAHVESPVFARPDGVHFVIAAPEELSVVIGAEVPAAPMDRPGEFGPMVLDTSSTGAVSVIGPGAYEIGCRDGTRDTVLPVTAPLSVVDPAGYWLDDRITCADWVVGTYDSAEDAKGERGDILAAFQRNVTGLRPGDVVTRAGYPGANAEEVRIVRDGEIVAVATYQEREPGSWSLTTLTECGSAGIGIEG